MLRRFELGDPGPRFADRSALVRSAVSDEAALEQAPTPSKRDPPVGDTIERARLQLVFMQQQLALWKAAKPLAGAIQFIDRRRAELAADRRKADRLGAYCERVESDLGRMLVVGTESPVVRIIGWLDQPETVVPGVKQIARIAAHGQQLLVMREYEAQLLDESGKVARSFGAAEGFQLVGLDTLPATEGRPAVLVLAAQALDERLLTRFSLFAL